MVMALAQICGVQCIVLIAGRGGPGSRNSILLLLQLWWSEMLRVWPSCPANPHYIDPVSQEREGGVRWHRVSRSGMSVLQNHKLSIKHCDHFICLTALCWPQGFIAWLRGRLFVHLYCDCGEIGGAQSEFCGKRSLFNINAVCCGLRPR